MESKFFTQVENGVILNLRILPNSCKNEISGIYNNSIKIKINAVPENGKANNELISFLSKKLEIKKTDIIILKGEKNKEKKILIKCFDINKIEKNLIKNINGG